MHSVLHRLIHRLKLANKRYNWASNALEQRLMLLIAPEHQPGESSPGIAAKYCSGRYRTLPPDSIA